MNGTENLRCAGLFAFFRGKADVFFIAYAREKVICEVCCDIRDFIRSCVSSYRPVSSSVKFYGQFWEETQ